MRVAVMIVVYRLFCTCCQVSTAFPDSVRNLVAIELQECVPPLFYGRVHGGTKTRINCRMCDQHAWL